MSENNYLRTEGAPGGITYGVWECPECGAEVQSDTTTYGLDCHECGAVVVER